MTNRHALRQHAALSHRCN